MTFQELVERGNALDDKLKANEIQLPTMGVEYLIKTKNISDFLTSALEVFRKSILVYDFRFILSSWFEKATLHYNLRSLITVVKKMNEHRLSIRENRSVAVRLESSSNEWIIHRNTDIDGILVIETANDFPFET